MPHNIELDKAKIKFEAPASALALHNPEIQAADTPENDKAVGINIYSTIGEYGDGNGMTPKIMTAILKKAAGRAVTVNINSPGGNVFEGIALHSLLSQYEGDVTIKILGLAASAASIVALAGDRVEIAKAGMFMIHNAWTLAMGNKHDLTDAADSLDKLDNAMAQIYAAATGMDEKAIKKLMDAETWMSGEDAVAQKFAQSLLGEEAVKNVPQDKQASALRKADVALAKSGQVSNALMGLLFNVQK